MTWLSVTGRILSYIVLPFTTLFRWILGLLLVALAPVLHLGQYILEGLLLPLRLIARFETMYIYLGIAAIIGLATGSILYLTSNFLVSILNLEQMPEDKGRTAASVRAAREQKKLGDAWQSSTGRTEQKLWRDDIVMEKKYTEWVEKNAGKRREDQGLLGQTILEEEDSDDDF